MQETGTARNHFSKMRTTRLPLDGSSDVRASIPGPMLWGYPFSPPPPRGQTVAGMQCFHRCVPLQAVKMISR